MTSQNNDTNLPCLPKYSEMPTINMRQETNQKTKCLFGNNNETVENAFSRQHQIEADFEAKFSLAARSNNAGEMSNR